jgi:hypothetical protein
VSLLWLMMLLLCSALLHQKRLPVVRCVERYAAVDDSQARNSKLIVSLIWNKPHRLGCRGQCSEMHGERVSFVFR